MNRIILIIVFVFFAHFNCEGASRIKALTNERPFSEQVKEANTKYVVRTDIVIDKDMVVPENCVFEFDGGLLTGSHVLSGRNTMIEAGLTKIFGTEVVFDGTWSISVVYPEWFGGIPNIPTANCSFGIQKAIEFSSVSAYSKVVKLQGARYYCKEPITLVGGKNYHIYGNGDATLVASGDKMKYLLGREGTSSSDAEGLRLILRDVTFDANYRCDYCVYMPSMSNSTWYNVSCISAVKCNFFSNYSFINSFYGCKFFSGDPYGRPTKFDVFLGNQACNAILFSGCQFEGAYVGAYTDNGYNVVFSSCTFEGLRSTGIYVNRTECCAIENCYFEDVSWHRETKDIKSPRYIKADDLGVTFTACSKYKSTTSNNDVKTTKINPLKIHACIVQNNESLHIDSNLGNLTLGFRDSNSIQQKGRYSGRKIIIRGNTFQHIKTKGIPNDCSVFSCGAECLTMTDNSSEAIDIVGGLGQLNKEYKPQNIIIPRLNGVLTSNGVSSTHNANHLELDDSISVVDVK